MTALLSLRLGFQLLAFTVIVVFPFWSEASDWPQFRGSDSTGASPDATIPVAPKVAWAADLPGRGLSCPIVVGNKVFVTCASGTKQDRLHVMCFDRASGVKQWERQLKATGRTMSHPKTSVAAPSPCSDGHRIFAIWSSNDVAAFDLQGNLLWLRGLTVDYPNVSNSLGMASSLIMAGETVIAPVENDSESYTIGLDASTGKNLWKMERPKAANWSTPVVWRPAGQAAAVAVLQSPSGLVGVDSATGSCLWEYGDGSSSMSSSVATKEAIYAVSHGVTALLPKSTGEAPQQLWRNEQLNASTVSLVLCGEKLYAINSAGVLVQSNLKGERGWKTRLQGPFSGSPVAAGNLLLAVSEKGLVQVVDTATTDGAVVGKLDLKDQLKDKELILSTPALCENSVFIRSDGHLWCLQ